MEGLPISVPGLMPPDPMAAVTCSHLKREPIVRQGGRNIAVMRRHPLTKATRGHGRPKRASFIHCTSGRPSRPHEGPGGLRRGTNSPPFAWVARTRGPAWVPNRNFRANSGKGTKA